MGFHHVAFDEMGIKKSQHCRYLHTKTMIHLPPFIISMVILPKGKFGIARLKNFEHKRSYSWPSSRSLAAAIIMEIRSMD
jgi:hypothetical protein